MSKLGVLVAVGLALAATGQGVTPAPAQTVSPTVVYLVRHAETAPDGTDDPPLSEAGRERAERLARMLTGAGLTAVHTTPYSRTRGTAGAVARATGLTVEEYDPGDLPALVRALRSRAGRHLVVGHSNTTPALVRLLGGDPGGPMAEDEHGRVYQLTLEDGTVHTAILGYPGGFLADPPAGPGAATARAEDVASLDAIVAALYDVISGPAGEPRDWDRLRSLFLPTARMLPVQRAGDGRVVHRVLTVEEYIRGSGAALVEMGFREREVARRVDRFGYVAHVFSTYEATRAGSDEAFLRGINSIQLIDDGDRWWIASIAWSPARPDLPIPPEYRGPGG